MPNKNMKIWETLSKTNPEFTKPLPGYGGKTLTTIDPMYQIQMMTDLFGPVGLGWKYKVDYKYIDGLVFAEVTIKYFTNEWHEYGPVCSVQNLSKSNNKLDDEAPKKAMTDAMTKAFSHLGMSADVFLGKFDDSKYVEQMKQEFSQPQPQKIPKTNGKRNIELDMQFNMDQIKKDIKKIDDIYLLRLWKKNNPNLFDSNQMSVREYRQITDLYGTRLTQLNQQGVV
tara:strand:+ start:893 stop:1570 length:678 start_codon:yes stop_codon:yes gene_type:complete